MNSCKYLEKGNFKKLAEIGLCTFIDKIDWTGLG